MGPGLNTIKTLTQFIFVADRPAKADLLVVPGSSQLNLLKKAVKLYKHGFVKKILFTGGFNQKINQNEADFGLNYALRGGIPNRNISTETSSSNTKENAVEAAKLIKKGHLKHSTIMLLCKPYHSRRLKMTFSSIFPKAKVIIVPVEDDRKITRLNWWKDKNKTQKVMEEVKKIGEYYMKGDLSL